MDDNISMNLQELRQKLSESGFSETVIAKFDAVLEKSITGGVISEDDKTEIKELMDSEIEAVNDNVRAMEEFASLIEEKLSEPDSNDDDDDSIYTAASKEIGDVPVEPVVETQIAPATTDIEPAPTVYPWSQPAKPVEPAVPEEPVAPVSAPVTSFWNQPVIETPVAETPVSETPTTLVTPSVPEPAPVVAPWNQPVIETPVAETPVSETPTTQTQPAPFPGSSTGQV